MPTTKETAASLPPFGIEADHPRNSDLLIQSIPGCKLRSAIGANKPVHPSAKDNEERRRFPMVPRDQATALGQLPPLPGMKLHVNPEKLTYVIEDPLYEDEELMEILQQRMEASGMPVSGELRGVAPQKGTLDVHRMKTLCRELLNIIEAGEARMVKGIKPDLEDINEMPGNYLLNPGARIPNSQPQFEKDMPEYVENLRKVGG